MHHLGTVKHYKKVVLDTTLALETLFLFCLFGEANKHKKWSK